MAHGAGGTIMHDLIKKYIVTHLGGSNIEVPLEALDDAAVVGDIVLKSDSHAVKPIFFSGGDIGRLAVAGTVNDIAVMGAEPIALSCGFVLEEGLQMTDFKKIVESMEHELEDLFVSDLQGAHNPPLYSHELDTPFADPNINPDYPSVYEPDFMDFGN